MSKYHAVSSGMVTRQALPAITRQRGTTTGSANLMLYGAGKTTVSNNTTFVDSSANAFTITNNGSPVQSGYNPFSQASAGAGTFNGTTDYLTAPASANFNLTGDFTIEGWVWIDSTVVSSRPDNNKSVSFFGGFGASGGTGLCEITGTTTTAGTGLAIYQDSPSLSVSVTTSVPLNTWVHIAFVRSGTTIYGFINGTRYTLGTSSAAFISSANPVAVGRNLNTSYLGYFKGYISNVRVVKGTAVYTSNFTPPTSPLTAITNTSLLLLMDNYSIVNSTPTNLPVTINGNTTISTAQFPTGMSSSMYFDGNGDYLSVADNSAFEFADNNFTIEAYLYVSSFTAPNNVVQLFGQWGPSVGNYSCVILVTAVEVSFAIYNTFGSYISYISTTTINTGAWNHIAVSRSGSNLFIFLNGTQIGSTHNISTNNIASTATNSFLIGYKNDTAQYLNGYISNVRVCKGTALYTANFTPPSLPMSTTVTVPAYVTNNIYGMNQIP